MCRWMPHFNIFYLRLFPFSCSLRLKSNQMIGYLLKIHIVLIESGVRRIFCIRTFFFLVHILFKLFFFCFSFFSLQYKWGGLLINFIFTYFAFIDINIWSHHIVFLYPICQLSYVKLPMKIATQFNSFLCFAFLLWFINQQVDTKNI